MIKVQVVAEEEAYLGVAYRRYSKICGRFFGGGGIHDISTLGKALQFE